MRARTEVPIGRDAAPDELTPDERLQEIAAILARGVLRLRKHFPTESAPSGLDSSSQTSLTGSGGLRRESPQK